MMQGVQHQEQGLRKAAFLIHCSLVERKNRVKIHESWPLPFDGDMGFTIDENTRLEYLRLKGIIKNKVNGN